MDLYEIVDGRTLKKGLPVDREHLSYPYVIVGEWWRHSNDNSYWYKTHGTLIRLDAGLQLSIADDGTTRVMSGELVYRENQLWLRPSDTSGALVLYKYNAPTRNVLYSGKPFAPQYSRSLNAEDVEVNFQYGENSKMVHALMTLRPGAKLSVTETRILRVAGTGATWGRPFNFKKEKGVPRALTSIEFAGTSAEEIAAAVAADTGPAQETVMVEAWTKGSGTNTFATAANSEPNDVRRQAARALAVDNPADVKYEEVAAA